ncbi:MAG: type IV toxin-antitoxin system AbiEi family antitoxin domain-containing protein, partial [Propionicimonas sp.]|nr:type IV toxin-antitoxin system AbiEi family antitoxin domain-containing protein [Propionicimonas sp.]
MRYREVLTPQVRGLLLRQAGMLTVHQAGELGIGRSVLRRLVEQGHWRRVAERLYDGNPLHHGFDKLA